MVGTPVRSDLLGLKLLSGAQAMEKSMLKIVNGSLLDSDCQYIAHQCNCHSRRGAGLASAIFKAFLWAVGGLPITVALGHQQQCMVTLPLVTIKFLIFVTSRSFQEVWLAQHYASFFRKGFQRDDYILSAPAPYLGVPGI